MERRRNLCLAGQGVSMMDFFRFLSLTTAGNVAGSFVFVALIKYGHAKHAGGPH